MSQHRAVVSASVAVALLALQLVVLRYSTSETLVRFVLPATIAAVPAALWVYRQRLGIWIIFVGVAANLTAILANGGLMPIERATVVSAIGEERAADYAPGEWIQGSKDVLVPAGGGRLTSLGDQIIIPLGGGGMAVSPGDIVIWSGLMVLVGEFSWSWQRRVRPQTASSERGRQAAEGGAAT